MSDHNGEPPIPEFSKTELYAVMDALQFQEINHHGGPVEGIHRRHRRALPAPRPDNEPASDHGNRQGGDQPMPLWAPGWPRAGA